MTGTTCPRQRFTTLAAARIALTARRARARLAGGNRHDTAYPCERCGGAHITRAPIDATSEG